MPALALRRNVLAPFAIAAVLTFALSLAARDAAAANQSVAISNFAFGPATVTVAVGETVTWTNNDAGIPHTASSDTPGVFDSGSMNSGVTFAKTFTEAGTFAYHCNIHPSMTGTVIVTAAAVATSTAPAATATTAAPTATAAATAPTVAPTPTAVAPPPPPSVPAATSAAVSPTSASSLAGSPTSAPLPPAAGDGDDNDGGSTPLIVGAGVAILVVAAGGTAYAIRQRRGQI